MMVPAPEAGRATLIGRVEEATTDQPLDGATVTLGTGEFVEPVEDDGYFEMVRIVAGDYPIRVRTEAYEALVDTIEIAEGSVNRMRLELPPDPSPGEEITVRKEERARTSGVPGEGAPARDSAGTEGDVDRLRALAEALKSRGDARIGLTTHGGNLGAGLCLTPGEAADDERPTSCVAVLVSVDGHVLQEISAAAGAPGEASFQVSTARLRAMEPEEVRAGDVLPPVVARTRYGPGGRYGAIVVRTADADLTTDEAVARRLDAAFRAESLEKAPRGDTIGQQIERAVAEAHLAPPLSSTAEVVGRVVDFETGEPLEGARVSVPGGGSVHAVTDSAGRFVLREVPFGRHAIEVSYGGWSRVADTVAVRRGEPVALDIRVPTRAIEIEGITVAVLSREELGFRARGRSGDYLGGEEMASIRERARSVGEIVRQMGSPRVAVMETSGDVGSSLCIGSTRRSRVASASRCNPMLIIVDGQVMQDVGGRGLNQSVLRELDPASIESVRVLTPVEGRFKYGERGQNGVIIIETR